MLRPVAPPKGDPRVVRWEWIVWVGEHCHIGKAEQKWDVKFDEGSLVSGTTFEI